MRSNNKIHPGSKIGELTVVADSGKRKNGYIVWHCRCSCGNEIDVEKRALEKGTVKSCGCKPKMCASMQDITGQRFGRLTAEYNTGRKAKNGSYIWHLKCDCGNTVEDNVSQLKAGYRKSCGCISRGRKEQKIESNYQKHSRFY